jgi:hypothetical protein
MDLKGREGDFQFRLRKGSLAARSREMRGNMPEGSWYSTESSVSGWIAEWTDDATDQ